MCGKHSILKNPPQEAVVELPCIVHQELFGTIDILGEFPDIAGAHLLLEAGAT
jgi:hypothetical protein